MKDRKGTGKKYKSKGRNDMLNRRKRDTKEPKQEVAKNNTIKDRILLNQGGMKDRKEIGKEGNVKS